MLAGLVLLPLLVACLVRLPLQSVWQVPAVPLLLELLRPGLRMRLATTVETCLQQSARLKRASPCQQRPRHKYKSCVHSMTPKPTKHAHTTLHLFPYCQDRALLQPRIRHGGQPPSLQPGTEPKR